MRRIFLKNIRFIEPFSIFFAIITESSQQRQQKNMHFRFGLSSRRKAYFAGGGKFTVGTINKNLCRNKCQARESRTLFYEVLYCTVWHEIKSADGGFVMAKTPTSAN